MSENDEDMATPDDAAPEGKQEGVPAASSPLLATPTPLTASQILFEDHHLLVVNKPAPLLTQAPPGIPSLEAMAKAYIKEKYAKPAGVYLGMPHRLDRPVSGVVCFARNTKAAQRIHSQFQEHKVRKVYWAFVEGDVTPDVGVWEDWMRKLADQARVERANEGEPGAKLAMLEYRVLRKLAGATPTTLVELAPLTGRMHQLRVQSAWRGHPVIGDVTYGSTRTFGQPAELPRDRVIALHARSLRFTHPFTQKEVTCIAPPPEYWEAVSGSLEQEDLHRESSHPA